MWRFITCVLLVLWSLFNWFLRWGGDIQTVQTWTEQKAQFVKIGIAIVTWPYTPLAVLTVLVIAFAITEFGLPWRIQKHRDAEQAV
jgi:TRAP-type C4-dicarboxylate transport system permease small subunit